MTLESARTNTDTSWWGQPSGGREVLRVAAPLVVSSLSWTIMTFVDRMMLNWVSGTAMDASFKASMLWFAILALPLGICSYTNTFVAQYDGAGRQARIGLVVWQAIWIACGLGALFLMVIPFAPVLLSVGKQTPEAFQFKVQYFQILSLCGPAMLISQSAGAFYSGRGQTWVVMVIDSVAAVLNLGLDYAWIFGYYGFPEWGVAGAAWATVVATWLKTIVYVSLPLLMRYRERYGTVAGIRWDGKLIRRILYFGWPSGFQMFLDVVGFTAFILLLGDLGRVATEATSMAFSVSSLAFMPIYGLHIAVSVLVGERLGENRDDLAGRATFTTLQVAWAYMAVISLLYAFLPDLFLQGFFLAGKVPTTEQIDVRQLTATLLMFVAAYNLLDATQMILVGTLKGAGDTQFLLRVSLVLATLLGGFSYFSVRVWNLDVYGCWTLVVFWCLLAAVTYTIRYRQGKWRTMRVIEQPAVVGGERSEVGGQRSEGPRTVY